MQQRIYAITDKHSGSGRLILAQNPAQALRHVANDLFEVKAASAAVVARLMGMGAKVEDVTAAPEAAEAEAVEAAAQAA